MSADNVIPIRGTTAGLVDPMHVQWALAQLFCAGIVVEVRCVGAMLRGDRRPYNKPRVIAGYFNSSAAAAEQLLRVAEAKAIYLTLNPVLPAMLARSVNRLSEIGKDGMPGTTTDDNIDRRRWLLIDIDSVRPAGISATDEEHDAALALAPEIQEWLAQEHGWPAPIYADSANGAHLLYRIDLPNDDDSRDMIQRCLDSVGAIFDAPPADVDAARNGREMAPATCTIDRTVFNASRICKLYGTLACKGDATAERPHRMSRIIEAPDATEIVSAEQLAALAALAPEEPKKEKKKAPATGAATFDVGAWVDAKLGDLVGAARSWKGGGRRWVFDVCPFNAEHSRGEAWIAEMPSGAAAAGCHHDSCGWGWAELRERFDPKISRPRATRPTERPKPWGGTPTNDAEAMDRLRDVLRWTVRKDGSSTLQVSQHNLSNLLRMHPAAPNLWLNSFSRTTYVELRDGTRRAIGDKDYTIAREWISDEFGVEFPVTSIAATMDQIAGEHQRNPLVEWLRGLEWDGLERLDHWLCYALSVPEEGIAPIYGRKFLVSAVARALDPGSKVDTMLVLTGPQGTMKSTLFHALAGDEYFCDTPLDLTQRQVYLSVEASWFVEFAELASFRKAEIERIKAFVTSRKDTYTPPYGRCVVTSPRHCVFVGTTNEEEFLKDQTGNRRFWCVRCGDRINVEWVRKVREQLWAEAVAAYDRRDETQWPWWLSPGEEQMHAVAVQEFEEADPLTDRVLQYVEMSSEVQIVEVTRRLRQEADVPANRGTDNRVGAILAKAGWKHTRRRIGGRTTRVWVKPGDENNDLPRYHAALYVDE